MKAVPAIPIILVLTLLWQDALSQAKMGNYCVAITHSNNVVKGMCGTYTEEGEFIKKVTIKDSLNRKIKLPADSIRMLLSSANSFSSIYQLNEREGIVYEPLIIDNKKIGLAQVVNWKTATKLKVFIGPLDSTKPIPKGLFKMEDGFQYEEQTFWISKTDLNPLSVSRKNFEAQLNLLFSDCPTFHKAFIQTKTKYKELVTYINDYNRLCIE